MEQALPFLLGERISKRSSASHTNYVSSLGYPSWEAFNKAAWESDLLDSFAKKQYFGPGSDDPIISQPLGYQSFVSSKNPYPEWNSLTNFKQTGFSYPYWDVQSRLTKPTQITFLTGREARPSVWAGNFRSEASLRGIIPSDTSFASARAWNTMQPRFESDANLVVTLAEMPEMVALSSLFKAEGTKRLSAQYATLTKSLKIPQLIRTAPKLALSGLSKVMADQWLWVSLAIMPTLSDLATIADTLSQNVDTAQNEFATRGDGNTQHYTETLYESDSLTPGLGNKFYRLSGSRSKVTFTASMNYGYKYRMRNHVDALRKYLGGDITVAAMYELVPLSFLLDYFFTLGSAIDAMERDPNVSDLRVFNYSESVLSTITVGNFSDTSARNVALPIINGEIDKVRRGIKPIAGCTSSLYRRVLTTPNKGTYIPKFKSPSTKQAWTSLAVLRMFI